MGIIIFNLPGLIMIAAAFGTAFGIGELLGWSTEGFLTSFGGAFLAAFDLAYRLLRRSGHWLTPDRGGSLFFLPAWCFGCFWIVLGVVYIVRGE